MTTILQYYPQNDPLAVAEKRIIIDQVLEDHSNVPGIIMVILTELQNRIGSITKPMHMISTICRQNKAYTKK